MAERGQRHILYTGKNGHTIRQRWLDDVIERVRQLDTTSWMWLVPGRDLADDLRHQVLQRVDRGALQLNFLTFDQLTRLVIQQAEQAFYMMPRHLQQRLVAGLMSAPENQDLNWEGKPLQEFADSPGTIQGILQVIALLKRHLIEPEHLHPPDEQASEEYRILYHLYRGYQKKLKTPERGASYQLLDLEQRYLEAAAILQERGITSIFPDLMTVYVDSFIEFEPMQRLFFQQMTGLKQVEIYYPYEKEQWDPLHEVYRDANENLQFFRANGFELTSVKSEHWLTEADGAPDLYALATASPEKEWLTVLKQIKKLLKQGTPAENIAIVTYRKPLYQDEWHHLLQTERIPVRYDFHRPLFQMAELDDLCVLYTLGENRFDRHSLQHLAGSPHLFYHPGQNGIDPSPSFPVAAWAAKMGIHSGFGTWLNTIDHELSRQYDSRLAQFKKWLFHLSERISHIPKRGKLSDHVLAMEKLVRETLIVNRDRHDQPEQKNRGAEAANHLLQLLAEMRRTSSHVNEDQEYTPSSFVSYLTELGRGIQVIMASETKGIRLLEPIQARGLSFSHMFFVGMNEGEFPARERHMWFLTEGLQRELNGIIDCRHVMTAREQYKKIHFYQAMASCRKTAVFSYVAGRKDVLRSRYLDELMRREEVKELDAGPYLNGPLLFPENWQDITNPREWRDWTVSRLRQLLNIEQQDDRIDTMPILDEACTREQWKTIVKRASIEFLREKGEGLPYHGRLMSPDIRRSIESKLPEAFSVTYFNTYGQCPFKFFMSSVLGMAEEEEETIDIDPMEKGNIYHDVLQRLYRELFISGENDMDLSDHDPIFAKAKRIFEERWQQIFAERYQEESLRNTIEKERMWNRLRRFISFDLERLEETPVRPRYFEWGFGMNGKRMEMDTSSVKEPLVLEGIPFRGKIDRIDMTSDGLFVVFDYKTSGGAVDISHIKEGFDFQLPIYVKAVKELLLHHEGSALGAAYYSVEKRDYASKSVFHQERIKGMGLDLHGKVRGKKEEDWEMIMEESIHLLPEYLQSIREGNYQVRPRVDLSHCNQYCPYRRICRYTPAAKELEGEGE